MKNDLVQRLRKRAQIRRQIQTRKSVQESKPDRIADLLEEAAEAIYHLRIELTSIRPQLEDLKKFSCEEYLKENGFEKDCA